jgi:hypothetical protein
MTTQTKCGSHSKNLVASRWCRPIAGAALATLLNFAVSAAPDLTTLFHDADKPAQPDGTPVTLHTDGIAVVAQSVRFSPRPGLTDARNTLWCGVTLETDGQARQVITTIGTGDTEALSCDGLDQIGTLSSKGGHARLALLYRTRSPSASGLTPIVLSKSNGWTIDEAASRRMAELPGKLTLGRMQANAGH